MNIDPALRSLRSLTGGALRVLLMAILLAVAAAIHLAPVAAQAGAGDCGHLNERACCFGERAGGTGTLHACYPDLYEKGALGYDDACARVTGSEANCHCSDDPDLAITGVCLHINEDCGGPGERSCCGAAAETNTCDPGLASHERAGEGCDDVLGPESCGCNLGFGGLSEGVCLDPMCGGEGERACCTGEGFGLTDQERPDLGGSGCEPPLIAMPGCAGDCDCSDRDDGSDHTCIQPSACGGLGERACCAAPNDHELPHGCEVGVEVAGCVGDCQCGGLNKTYTNSTGMCTDPGYDDRSEPPTGWTAPALGPACPLLGYADLHEHLLAHLAHGGTVTAGTPAPIGGDASFTLDGGLSVKDALDPEDDESLHTDNHGLLLGDPIGKGLGDIATGTTGYPLYNHWPHWTSATHQQMYYKWLERAWRGGMRLMVQLAVTNEALCYINPRAEPRSTDCNNSMKLVNAQTEAAYDFERFIDEQSGQDFPDGTGWFRIVTSPQQARRVIAAGKLAVVLGIEMDKLFNCEKSDPARICPDPSDFASLSEAVAQLHDDGIRYVFPIHDFDNAFGGTADWSSAIDAGQGVATANPANEDGERNALYQAAENCPSVPGVGDYGFRLDEGAVEFILLAGFPGNVVPGSALLPQIPDYGDLETTCNPNGLTQPGLALLRELMARGMIIDVDHMSRHAFYQTVAFGVHQYGPRGYPLVAGHVQSFELHTPDIRHERMRTPQQLALIRDSGGMIAAMTKDDVQDTGSALLGGHAGEHDFGPYPSLIGGEPRFGPRIEDSCRHSSRTFAQAYQYAVDVMEGPVALGPDFMGLAGHVGPRFGSEACGNIFRPNQPSIEEEKSRQIRSSEKLAYPFTLDGFGEFSRQQTNLRTFDFNDDGLAHVGLLPDLIADMKLVGLSDRYVDALFHSGEEYIRVWELAEARANKTDPPEPAEELSCPELCLGPELDETPPPITCTNFTIECTGEETHVFTSNFATAGEDNCGGAVGVQCDESGRFEVGPTTSTCTASDDAGNESGCQAVIAVVDDNPPSITAPPDLSDIECTSPSGASPSLGDPAVSDLCDPGATFDNDAPGPFPVGPTTVTWTAADGSGNVSQASQIVTVVDTTRPSNTCPGDVTIGCDDSREPWNTGEARATDTCDSAPEVTSSDAEVAGACADESVVTRTWSATDAAGNAGEDCDQTIQVVDTTAPVVACNAPATIVPPDAPVSFTATAPDNCDPNAIVEIVGFDCFAFTQMGKRIDKTEDGCVAAITGDTFTILDSGGVGDSITWTVRATDRCGGVSETVCGVGVELASPPPS